MHKTIYYIRNNELISYDIRCQEKYSMITGLGTRCVYNLGMNAQTHVCNNIQSIHKFKYWLALTMNNDLILISCGTIILRDVTFSTIVFQIKNARKN